MSRQYIILTSFRTVRTRQRITHCFTTRSQIRPQCSFISRSPYTLHYLDYNYSTTVLLQLSYSYHAVLILLDLICCLFSKGFIYNIIKLISAHSAVIDSSYTDKQVWIQDVEMLILFMKSYISGFHILYIYLENVLMYTIVILKA